MFYGLSTNPVYYNERINLMIGMGPLTRMTKSADFNQAVCKVAIALAPYLPALGINEVLTEN